MVIRTFIKMVIHLLKKLTGVREGKMVIPSHSGFYL